MVNVAVSCYCPETSDIEKTQLLTHFSAWVTPKCRFLFSKLITLDWTWRDHFLCSFWFFGCYTHTHTKTRWWQLKYFLFSPLFGEDFPFWLIFFQIQKGTLGAYRTNRSIRSRPNQIAVRSWKVLRWTNWIPRSRRSSILPRCKCRFEEFGCKEKNTFCIYRDDDFKWLFSWKCKEMFTSETHQFIEISTWEFGTISMKLIY